MIAATLRRSRVVPRARMWQAGAMAPDALIQHYGVIAIFLGAGIEGEAVVLAGGALARGGLIPLVPACFAAAVGACVADQAWFFAGRHYRDHPRVRAIARRPAFARAMRVFSRHPVRFTLGFRFLYGARTVSPIAIATSRFPTRWFVLLDALAAAVWGPTFTLLGYAFGRAAERLLGRAVHWGFVGLAVVAVVAAVLLAIRFVARRRA